MNIVFFGSSEYVISIIQTLHDNFDLTLVVTTEKNNSDPVPAICNRLDISYVSAQSLNNDQIESNLRNCNAPVAVVASFGLLIPEEIIAIFPKGIVNIHPSFLPEYRGTTPIQQALLDGKTQTAVSIMLIDQELDHGPLLAQIPLEITPEDTTESLYTTAFKLGAQKLVDILPAYVSGNIEPRDQDHTKATYTPRHLTKHDGFIDIHQIANMSALEIENWKLKIARLIRAYYPWPGVWTKVKINNQEKILKFLPNPNVIERSQTMKKSPVDDILFQVEGKKPVSKKDLINGYPELKKIIEKLP